MGAACALGAAFADDATIGGRQHAANAGIGVGVIGSLPAQSQGAIHYALSIAVAFGTSLALVLIFDYRTPEEKAEILAKIAAEHGETPPAVA